MHEPMPDQPRAPAPQSRGAGDQRPRRQMYATLRLIYPGRERFEAFADISQAALWTIVHLDDATWANVSVEAQTHASFEAVQDILAGDDPAFARFLARVGEEDSVIAARLAGSEIDLAATLAAARDELAAMAEHDEN